MYKKIKPQLLPEGIREVKMRELWYNEYCLQSIETFDGVKVYFYEDMFDHCFFESKNRKKKDKSILSLNRLEKIYWIKEALKDPKAILKKGWNNEEKEYYTDRRVAIVNGNFIVIIRFTGYLKAKFVTAYEKNDINNVLQGPDFEKNVKYFGNK